MTDEISQAEKKQILNDTYLSRAQADAELEGQGRFKKEVQTRVTGVPSYPSLPASSPWSKGLDEVTGSELPIGFDVNAQEPVGEVHEIQSSLGGPTMAPSGSAPPPAVETSVGPPSFLRRRV
jgi:hypothetical protein